jgi:hypothetical protein
VRLTKLYVRRSVPAGAVVVVAWDAVAVSMREVEEAVDRALAGEASLDVLMTAKLFPRGSPLYWIDWPPEAVRLWDAASRLYLERRRTERPAPTQSEAWDAVLAVAPDPARWWRIPGVTWDDLAPYLRLSPRALRYQLCDLQGWRMKGRGQTRTILAAPCVACGDPQRPSDLRNRRCPRCTSKSADPDA